MALPDFQAVFSKIRTLRVGVFGDFALDMYYNALGQTAECSVETGKPVLGASTARTSPGAAGNVTKNLATWHPASLHLFGVTADDLFGRELRHYFAQMGANCDNLVVQREDWTTYTYVKPMHKGVEQNRLDFGFANRMSDDTVKRILEGLSAMIGRLDVLFVNQQLGPSLLTPEVARRLNPIIAQSACLVLADCRKYGQYLEKVIVKMNTKEIAVAMGVGEPDPQSDRECESMAAAASKHLKNPVLLTRGEYGLVFVSREGAVTTLPGIPIETETDAVGAGDTCISAFGSALATGAPSETALRFANLAAAVVVSKTGQTGIAEQKEIEEMHKRHS